MPLICLVGLQVLAQVPDRVVELLHDLGWTVLRVDCVEVERLVRCLHRFDRLEVGLHRELVRVAREKVIHNNTHALEVDV